MYVCVYAHTHTDAERSRPYRASKALLRRHSGAMKPLLRRYEVVNSGAIQALLRRSKAAIQALFRCYSGAMKPLLKRYEAVIQALVRR